MRSQPDGSIGPAIVDGDGANRYATFISYRHVEPDRTWAKWLHRELETYRIPRRLRVERNLPGRVGRCFRDEEELPASDDLAREIDEALRESRFLVVICSPRIVSSRWCNAEVERFRELGRHNRILALLIEGEPAESFLPALREIRTTLTDAAGLTREQIQAVEPLAADVRAVAGESPRHVRRMAKLRLLAQILGIRFDDLRQREQERRARRLAVVAASAVLMTALTGGLAVAALLSRSDALRERGIARQNADEAKHQARIAADNERIATVQKGIAQDNEKKAIARLARFYEEQGRRELLGRNSDIAAVYLAAAYQLDSKTPSLRFLTHEALAVTAGTSAVLRAHNAAVIDARFTADATRVLTYGQDKAVNVWDARTGARLASGSGLFTRVGSGPLHLSPADGRWIVLQAERSFTKLDVYDAATLQKAGTITASRDIGNWAIAADGNRLFISHPASLPGAFGANFPKPALTAWSLPEGKFVKEIPFGGGDTDDVVPSFDGRRLVVGKFDTGGAGLELWDVDRAFLVTRLPTPLTSAAAFSPDCTRLAYSDQQPRSQIVRLVSADTGTLDASWDVGDVHVSKLAFSPDCKTLAAALARGATTVRLRDLTTGIVRDLAGNIGGVLDAEFSHDGRFLVSCDAGHVIVFDVNTCKVLAKQSPHEDKVTFCHFGPDASFVITGSLDRSARLWQWRGAAGVERWTARDYRRSLSAAFNATGERVVIAGDESRDGQAKADQHVRILDAGTGETLRTLGPLTEPAGMAVFLPDGKTVMATTAAATLRKDFQLRLWDVATGKVKQSLRGALGAVAPGGRIVAGTGFNSFMLYAADTGEQLSAVTRHKGRVERIAFSRSGRWLVTSSADMPLVLWDLRDPKAPVAVEGTGHAAVLNDLDFSADDHLLVTGSADGTARIWEIAASDAPGAARLRQLQTLAGHEGAVTAARLSPDGEHAVTGGLDGVAVEWDARTGQREWMLEPPPDEALKTAFGQHLQAITIARFNPDGQFLATGSADGFVRVWDARTGRLLLAQRVSTLDAIMDLNWSPDGCSLLVASTAGVRLLDVSCESLPPEQVADTANLRSRVRLTDAGIEPKPQPRPQILRAEDPSP